MIMFPTETVTHGFPLGSVLGPFLFIIYMVPIGPVTNLFIYLFLICVTLCYVLCKAWVLEILSEHKQISN